MKLIGAEMFDVLTNIIDELRDASSICIYKAGKMGGKRVPILVAREANGKLLRELRQLDGLRAMSAGSIRRWEANDNIDVGDVDIVVAISDESKREGVFEFLSIFFDKDQKVGQKGSWVWKDYDIQVDVEVVLEESFGAALLFATGSKTFNIQTRALARAKGMKLNRYGLFFGDERIAGEREGDIFAKLGLKWIPPEEREHLDIGAAPGS